MKKYNPNIHHRRSIRLKGYDYSQPGLYFITICIKNRICLLGEILYGKMILNDAGRMVEKWYLELENKYTHVKCGEMIVMPNHFHCIVGANQLGANQLGANLRVCPNTGTSLPQIVQWFKTMTTNEYIRGVKSKGWQPFNGKLWQRNYWEHIIRNERSYNNIVNYIRSNPMKWDADKINPIND